MSVLLPPSSRSDAAARPFLQERKFRVVLKCLGCRHPHPLEFTLFDEPDDPATRHDFYDSGVLDKIQFKCDRCGNEYASFTDVQFVEDPADPAKFRGEDV